MRSVGTRVSESEQKRGRGYRRVGDGRDDGAMSVPSTNIDPVAYQLRATIHSSLSQV
jgi:hypothetical protein